MPRFPEAAVCAAALFASVAVDAAPQPFRLVSNREIFDVSLERASGGAVAASGRTAIEFRVSCKGYSTLQRSIADLIDPEGAFVQTDFIVKAWESRDGRTLRFDMRSSSDGKLMEHRKGKAMLAANGSGDVRFMSPDKEFPLPRGTIFPTAQTLDILHAAAHGKSEDVRIVFQGGGKDGLLIAVAAIGKRAPHVKEVARDPDGLLKGAPAWPVLMSYYKGDSETPDSEIATHLYANGALGSMSLIYPGYTLRAKLVRIERLPSSC